MTTTQHPLKTTLLTLATATPEELVANQSGIRIIRNALGSTYKGAELGIPGYREMLIASMDVLATNEKYNQVPESVLTAEESIYMLKLLPLTKDRSIQQKRAVGMIAGWINAKTERCEPLSYDMVTAAIEASGYIQPELTHTTTKMQLCSQILADSLESNLRLDGGKDMLPHLSGILLSSNERIPAIAAPVLNATRDVVADLLHDKRGRLCPSRDDLQDFVDQYSKHMYGEPR